MRRSLTYRRTLLPALLLAAGSVGCGQDSTQGPPLGAGQEAPAFSVVDVNPTSPRSGEMVSPRDYLERVSAWYFGHAT